MAVIGLITFDLMLRFIVTRMNCVTLELDSDVITLTIPPLKRPDPEFHLM